MATARGGDAPAPSPEPPAQPLAAQPIEVLDELIEIESTLESALRRADEALAAHERACARSVSVGEVLEYARALTPRSSARPGWDGASHTPQQYNCAPTYGMLTSPVAWLQRAPAPPARPGEEGA